jgi:hypothetical protein
VGDPHRTTDRIPAVPTALIPGYLLSNYRLIKEIGHGTFGVVWAAETRKGKIRAAVKIIGEKKRLEPEELADERRILELTKNLNHPYLLQVHDVWEEGPREQTRLCVAMELADRTLGQRLEECQKDGLPGIPRDELVAYCEQVASALDYLHGKRVVHRDVKPANVLLCAGYAKVGDLGSVRKMKQDMTNTPSAGTPYCMAPEVWRHQLHIQSDQFSLAATYCYLRCGRSVFRCGSLVEAMQAITGEEPELSELPAEEKEVLRQALSKDPQERFPSCMVFVAALREACRPAPTSSSQQTAAVPAPSRRSTLLLSMLCALLAGALLAAWFLMPTRTAPTPPWLPPGYQKVGDETEVDAAGKPYYKQIEKVFGDDTRVRFMLVRRTTLGNLPGGEPDPATFYMMEHKVWLGLYRRYKPEHPGKDPDHPVFEVLLEDARRFAKDEFGGLVPTAAQWNKACGLYADRSELGPFEGPKVAVGREEPQPVHVLCDDLSRAYDCRDMAGNGLEWTRNIPDALQGIDWLYPDRPNKEPSAIFVRLRGQSYRGDRPLRFADLKGNPAPPMEILNQTSDELSFRVVLEPQ